MENTAPELSKVHEYTKKLKEQLQTRLIGQPGLTDQMIAGVLSGGHILIEGVPGLAKTLAVKLFARAVEASWSRIQFTPDLMPSDVTGTMVYNQKSGTFEFHKGPVFANFVLIDEINRAPAKTQSALFEVMEEQQITSGGNRYKLDSPFHVFATQNPIEHEGTYKLPEAQLDRFLIKIEVDYPGYEGELQILKTYQSPGQLMEADNFKPVISSKQLLEAREAVQKVHTGEEVMKYITDIIRKTREHPSLSLGASPRAGLALLATSRVMAAMNGRDYVTPEDVRFMCGPVLAHRVMLSPDQEVEGYKASEIIPKIINEVPVPR